MPYSDIISGASNDFGVPIDIIKSVIQIESSGNRYAVGSLGEKGLMQLMPGTAKELGVSNPFDPAQNIRAGARYLSQQYKAAGSWRDALAKYNGGKYYKGTQAQGYADKVLAGAPGVDESAQKTHAQAGVDSQHQGAADTSDAPWYIKMVNAITAKINEAVVKVKAWFAAAGLRIVLGLFAVVMIVLGIYKLINS